MIRRYVVIPGAPADELASDQRLLAERTRLVRLCASFTGSVVAAEDLAQETLVEAWRLRERVVDRDGLSSWLTAIARNVCLRWCRQRTRDIRRIGIGHDGDSSDLFALAADVTDLDLELERDELADLLGRAMALLPAETRQALIECYVEERSHGEVAGRLGLSEGAVGMRLMRGRLALRRVLDGELREEAESFGLSSAGDRWEQTRIWCPSCGTAKLLCLIDVANQTFVARCTACRTENSDRSAKYLGQVRGHRRTLLRSLREAHTYFRGALASGVAPCACCGVSASLKIGLPAGMHGPMACLNGVRIDCARCEAVSFEPESGLVLTLPEVARFWRREKRIRMRPGVPMDSEGRPATLTRFESVVAPAVLDVISLRESFEVVGAYSSRASVEVA
jgi:RNA polymerase sigma-70 factor (ECF subfamily)